MTDAQIAELTHRVIRAVAECHDGTSASGLWSHLRRDPGAFKRAVSGAILRFLEEQPRDS